MLDEDAIRSYMRERADAERSSRSVTVSGSTTEEALYAAVEELGVPMRMLRYEVIERERAGFLGLGRRPANLLVYVDDKASEDLEGDVDIEEPSTEDAKVVAVRDGEALVRLLHDSVFLKVTKPVGGGYRVTDRDALKAIDSRGVRQYDASVVSRVVEHADSEYVKIASRSNNPLNDAIVSVNISDNEMKVHVVISPPGVGGSDLTARVLLASLASSRVVHGIKEDVVQRLEDHPVFSEPVLVAEGTPPIIGKSAKINYSFDKGRVKLEFKEKKGSVDFKDMNLIQNVVKGQVVAKKIPAESGSVGTTVLGKMLPTRDGEDVEIQAGTNVKLSSDGTSAIATESGQVVMSGDKINVEPIYEVAGDVNHKSGGNVIFLGNVFIKGSVVDGFMVKASGNIEVAGNVGKCEIDTDGDVIIHQGINGKGGGSIRSGRSVWTKFVENANVEAKEMLVASDGIINSKVVAGKRIVCQGKRASIVGGTLMASEVVRAKTLGSVSCSETRIEVGYDPHSVQKMEKLTEDLKRAGFELESLARDINTLKSQATSDVPLPDEKEAVLQQLTEKRTARMQDVSTMESELLELKEHLASLNTIGRISAENRVYPGVRVIIKGISHRVRRELGPTTFVKKDHMVVQGPLEKSDVNYSRKK